jgi:L-serine dehydratase
MEYTSVFDIIGPIMVGPSSSHTAGALEIAKFARQKFGKQPTYVEITLYNSFAKTYKGHGTDVALVGGILDFDPDDLRIPSALSIAKKEHVEIKFVVSDVEADHPNTVKLTLTDGHDTLEITGISIGGGSFKIVSEVWGEQNV